MDLKMMPRDTLQWELRSNVGPQCVRKGQHTFYSMICSCNHCFAPTGMSKQHCNSECAKDDRLFSESQAIEFTDVMQNAEKLQVLLLKSQNEAPAVAFSVALQTQRSYEFIGPFKEDFRLIYRDIITNVGSAYNKTTGMFTAPVKGVYFFTFVIFKPRDPSNSASGVKLMKNGEIMVSATDNVPGHKDTEDTEDTTSNSVILELDALDQVYIVMHGGRSIYVDGGRRSTFSGHLLYVM